ncbi:CpaF family protein [Candidatus Pacearchaeota archaeon CG_4_9_14_0_2_um_filter_39_13]|nr:CpaF family protein [Candidatus Pacearchaeota archaeon]OIO43105.1 MAG: hypothetical protein AUJ64_02895 [Candidatus Pacearchaeota archaeon CG1_02_39_14]PJC44953.1 MAG: CpaF family protein [Candidatus Pacearchaeota archaeon CG_4_9_14_0_2_um_filter_39_13]
MPKKKIKHVKKSGKKAHKNPAKIEIRKSSAHMPDYELKRQDIMERLQRLDPSFVPKEPPMPFKKENKDEQEETEGQKETEEKKGTEEQEEKEIQKDKKKIEIGLPKLPKKTVLEKAPDKYENSDESPALRAEEVIPIKTQDLEEKNAKLIEKYGIEVDKAAVSVEIKQTERGVKYYLHVPKIDIATTSLLNEIRNELISITTISMKELTDPNSLNTIKKRFMNDAQKILRENLPNLQQKSEDFLIGKLIQDMLGLGSIEFLINDPNLEEIVITSSTEPIRVFSKKYGWVSTNLIIEKEEEIVNYANIIARRVGRQINVLNPLLDAHLVTGDRINAVLYPINTKGNTITVRKFARDPFTIIDLIKSKTCDLDIAALLWLAIEYEMNILISGGTASGKTVFLNACMPFIPPNQRIISIEDTRELMLPQFLYWTPLVTRTPNAEGKGEVSMLHLLINSLRMRPDRIVLGEMRKYEEAMVLFEAMHTGHSVYATVHADSAAETVSRLTNPPLNVPPNLLRSVNLNVIMFRDRRKGIRRVLQVAEFEAGKDDAKANILYRWSPEEDRIIKHSESSRFFEEVSRHTGMSEQEMNKALEEKKNILSWLVKNEMRSLKEVGKVMDIYYKNKETLMKIISKNDKKSII